LLYHPGKAYGADSPSPPDITWQDEKKGATSAGNTGLSHGDFRRPHTPTRPGYRANPFASRPTHTFLCRACACKLKLANAFYATYDTMVDPPDVCSSDSSQPVTEPMPAEPPHPRFVAAIVVSKDVPLQQRHVSNPDSRLRDARDRPIGKAKQLAFTAGDATIVLNDGSAYWRSRYVKDADGTFVTRHEIFSARTDVAADTGAKPAPQPAKYSDQQPSPPPVQQPTQDAAAPAPSSSTPPTTDEPALATKPPQHKERLYYVVVKGYQPGIYEDPGLARASAQGDASNTIATFQGKRAAQAFFSAQQTLGHVDCQHRDSKVPRHEPTFIEHGGEPDKPERLKFACPRCKRKHDGMYQPGTVYCQNPLCKTRLNLN
jgi:hypothetical protein